nr:MAG TPA: hypothetical protein [Caudoviricetes sp.]
MGIQKSDLTATINVVVFLCPEHGVKRLSI